MRTRTAGRFRLSACAAVAVCLVGGASAWWDNGHMLVAEVARQTLEPAIVDQVNRLLLVFRPSFPNRTTFSPAATWADFLKCQSESSYCVGVSTAVNSMDAWHFSDRPFNPDNLTLPPEVYPGAWQDQPSSIDAVAQAVSTFRASKSPWGYGLMMLFSLHIIGDMHQPLHSISGYFNDARFGDLSAGDRGGNLIHVTWPEYPQISNLHAVWDSAGGLYQNNAPYSPEQMADLVANATALISEFPASSYRQFNPAAFDGCWAAGGGFTDPCKDVLVGWSNGSYELATSVGYGPGVKQNFTVTPDYVAAVQRTSKSQITLAGYRLATVIKAVVGTIPNGTLLTDAIDASSLGGGGSSGAGGDLTPREKGLVAALVLSWAAFAALVAFGPASFRRLAQLPAARETGCGAYHAVGDHGGTIAVYDDEDDDDVRLVTDAGQLA